MRSGLGSRWLQRGYGSIRRLVGPKRDPGDEEVAVGVGKPTSGPVTGPASLERRLSHRSHGGKTHTNTHEVEETHGPDLARLDSKSVPCLLSDEENDRLNRKISRLMSAIDDRRPIHFVPGAGTGEVEIFSDHNDEHELQQDIAAASESFGQLSGSGHVIRRIRSQNSLRATSTDSWASTQSTKSSSNAWERAVAAANIRFALELMESPQEPTVIRKSISQTRRGRPRVRKISPIPLDYYKPLRPSTPSIYSNDSEQDTSSPLFLKSCERVRQDTYAEMPESTLQLGVPEHPPLHERASVSEPRGRRSASVPALKIPRSTERAFGVFKEVPKGESSTPKIGRQNIRSKALKDVSNLRRPGYLQFNSFAKDSKPVRSQAGTAVHATSPSISFGGATDLASRRAYISTKWPGLLEDRGTGTMEELSRLDGVARRRNEQAIGFSIDTSNYFLTHVRSSVGDSSLNSDPVRQAHFDLALARLEGRALPPPPLPIHRYPDWAAISDRDIQIEGRPRPLPLRDPKPSRILDLQRIGSSDVV